MTVTIPGPWWMWAITAALGWCAWWLNKQTRGGGGAYDFVTPLFGCASIVVAAFIGLLWLVYELARRTS